MFTGAWRGSLELWILILICHFFEFCDWGTLAPHFSARSFICHLWRGLEVKDGCHGNYSGLFCVWHMGWNSVCASSVFHSLERAPSLQRPPSGTPCCFGLQLCKEFASLLSWGPHSSPVGGWAGCCHQHWGKLRSMHCFLHSAAAG